MELPFSVSLKTYVHQQSQTYISKGSAISTMKTDCLGKTGLTIFGSNLDSEVRGIAFVQIMSLIAGRCVNISYEMVMSLS